MIGCGCAVCHSDDPRNRRTRHGLLLEENGRRLLVDTPPELRLQLARAGVEHVDAVFLTHPHADHLHGIDDLRIFTLRSERALPVHVADEFLADLRRRFRYIWGPNARAHPGTSIPDLELVPFRSGARTRVAGFPVRTLAFPHGRIHSHGFRLGDLAVVVDGKEIPDGAMARLEGIRILVINALWFGDPHPTHFNVEEAIAVSERLGPRRTYLTHLTHRLDYATLDSELPDAIRPAYDGLEIEF